MANVTQHRKEAPEMVAIDLELCIICQKAKTESLVENPCSHEKVVEFIAEWAILYMVTVDILKHGPS